MRPAGEIRSAICEQLRSHGPMPLADLVNRVGIAVTPSAVSRTVENAVRAGVLAKVGREKRSHCSKPVFLYALPQDDADLPVHDGGMVVLVSVLSGWR